MCFANLAMLDCGRLVDYFRPCLLVRHKPLAFRAQKFQLALVLIYMPDIYLKCQRNYPAALSQRAQLRVYANHN